MHRGIPRHETPSRAKISGSLTWGGRQSWPKGPKWQGEFYMQWGAWTLLVTFLEPDPSAKGSIAQNCPKPPFGPTPIAFFPSLRAAGAEARVSPPHRSCQGQGGLAAPFQPRPHAVPGVDGRPGGGNLFPPTKSAASEGSTLQAFSSCLALVCPSIEAVE